MRWNGLRLSAVAVLAFTPSPLLAQSIAEKASLAIAAMEAVEAQHFSASQDTVVVAFNDPIPVVEAAAPLRAEVARRLGSEVVRVRDVSTCTTVRRCRLPEGKIYMGLDDPEIRGDTATIHVSVWSQGEGSTFISYRGILVTAERAGANWVVVKQELVEIS